jgi:hypothetical protein
MLIKMNKLAALRKLEAKRQPIRFARPVGRCCPRLSHRVGKLTSLNHGERVAGVSLKECGLFLSHRVPPARGFPHRSNVLPAAYAWNFWNDGIAPLSSRAKEKARLDVWPFPESVTPDARKMS